MLLSSIHFLYQVVCTRSRFSHCTIVLRDYPVPGVFVWESSWHPDSKIPDPSDQRRHKFGVQITPLLFYMAHYPGTVAVYVRRRKSPLVKATATLDAIFKHTLDRPYDIWPCDWAGETEVSNAKNYDALLVQRLCSILFGADQVNLCGLRLEHGASAGSFVVVFKPSFFVVRDVHTEEVRLKW